MNFLNIIKLFFDINPHKVIIKLNIFSDKIINIKTISILFKNICKAANAPDS